LDEWFLKNASGEINKQTKRQADKDTEAAVLYEELAWVLQHLQFV